MALIYAGRRTFSIEDRTLLTTLTSAIAQSLQRAILVDQSREIAAGLQSAMLPRRLPVLRGGSLAVRYRTARVGTWIGGDWYDAVALAEDAVGVAIGDVQGHDTEAAAIMGQLRIAMTAYASEGHSAASVLARASAFLADLPADRFATCLYAQVALATGETWLVNAGHLPPLVRRADGSVLRLDLPTGLPLGLPADWGRAAIRPASSGWATATACCSTPTGWWSGPARTWSADWPGWPRCSRPPGAAARAGRPCARHPGGAAGGGGRRGPAAAAPGLTCGCSGCARSAVTVEAVSVQAMSVREASRTGPIA